MGIDKVKAIELVMDWNLWPRHMVQRLDGTNLSRMKESLRNGFALPPVVVNRKDNRIVDGFHRTKAHLAIYGDDAEIEVEFRDYENDAEMYLAAGALNLHHGLPMSPQDRAHFIVNCRKLKIPPARIAEVLHIHSDKMKQFLAERTAKTQDNETIALPYGVSKAYHGKKLTREQERTVRSSNGVLPEMYVSMLLNHLRNDAIVVSDRVLNKLRELRDVIDVYLDEAVS